MQTSQVTHTDRFTPTVLYEDNHLLIIAKKPGEIVQGDKTGDEPLVELLKNWLKEKYSKPGNVFLGVVHRLDRPVGGVVVFAKTSKGLSRMSELFRKGDVKKTYWAVVCRKPPKNEDTITHHLVRNEKQNKSYAYSTPQPSSKEARLSYKLLSSTDKYHLLEVRLHTGRHHQIRCQLAAIGCVIKGDLKYGAPRSNPDGSIGLLSRNISFIHPVSDKDIDVTAPAPDDNLWNALTH
ncbi:RluA family pseudouridine synthase [Porphyromonas macacae]|uniref:Ribosomal large subunit pseudouridine synthase D n=1 Tax=Porphyromonas macacae TaxID=28115 RepID=A0A379DFG6_9PORP|nr:RNA pseudouridine synthase [Porphyromonas macacae]SUB76912.1 Ribosomal large subunit pseudouridine synthase D [Porphyromonas macacae]